MWLSRPSQVKVIMGALQNWLQTIQNSLRNKNLHWDHACWVHLPYQILGDVSSKNMTDNTSFRDTL